jgi:hypothetical protein
MARPFREDDVAAQAELGRAPEQIRPAFPRRAASGRGVDEEERLAANRR